MADDDLDELYWVRPDKFTATRSRLAAAAKERGDAESAKKISVARKPTTAAWVVNRLALSHAMATQRLTDLGERLRSAHAAMDGARIREMSHEQRKLIEELTRTAFDAAETTNPSAGVREDVTATLQAAIADPDVAGRLGRLAKPEQYSGFGDFGSVTSAETEDRPAERKQDEMRKAQAVLDEAEHAKADADEALAAARRRYAEAEAELKAAEKTSQDAQEAVKEAGRQLKRAGG